MLKLVNAALVCAVLFCAFLLYSQEHATRKLERAIAKTERLINEEREKIKLLTAEWSALSKPERIQKIATEQLHLEPLQSQQFVPMADVAGRLPAAAPLRLEAQDGDALGALLEKLQ